jgi:hypothetical protein
LQKICTPEPQEHIDITFNVMNWAYYEQHAFNSKPNILFEIASVEFKLRVAASNFLAPAFLEQFCRDWEGKSYLPANPQPFVDKLTQCISTIHDPDLANLATTLRQRLASASGSRPAPGG